MRAAACATSRGIPSSQHVRRSAGHHVGHVLTGDGEHVVETGRPERLSELGSEPLLLAEHDPLDERSPLTRKSRCDRAGEVLADPVGDAREPAASSDHPVATRAHDRVNALAAEIGGLVVGGSRLALPRRDHLGDHVENRTLRRCAHRRGKLELCRLVERPVVVPAHPHQDACRERAPPRGRRHLDARKRRASDLAHERAAVDVVEADAAPPPASREKRTRERDQSPALAEDRDAAERAGSGQDGDARYPDRKRERKPGTRRGCQHVRRRNEPPAAHGVTSSRSCSRRAGPMPGTASSSSTDVNGPCSSR